MPYGYALCISYGYCTRENQILFLVPSCKNDTLLHRILSWLYKLRQNKKDVHLQPFECQSRQNPPDQSPSRLHTAKVWLYYLTESNSIGVRLYGAYD